MGGKLVGSLLMIYKAIAYWGRLKPKEWLAEIGFDLYKQGNAGSDLELGSSQ